MMTLIPNTKRIDRYMTQIKQTSHIERPRMCKNVIYDATDVVLERLIVYNNLLKRFVIKMAGYIIIVGFFPRHDTIFIAFSVSYLGRARYLYTDSVTPTALKQIIWRQCSTLNSS